MIHTNEPEQRSAAVYSALLDTTQCLNSKHEHLTFALCPYWTGLLQRVNLATVTAIVSECVGGGGGDQQVRRAYQGPGSPEKFYCHR